MSTAVELSEELEFVRASRYRTAIVEALYGMDGGLTPTGIVDRRHLNYDHTCRVLTELRERDLVELADDSNRQYVLTGAGDEIAPHLDDGGGA